jgi:CheY-like chemotaxis protein
VLLIEDDAALATVDGELLEGPGDAVQVGGSGEGALTALTARAFDPMLTDVFVRAG